MMEPAETENQDKSSSSSSSSSRMHNPLLLSKPPQRPTTTTSTWSRRPAFSNDTAAASAAAIDDVDKDNALLQQQQQQQAPPNSNNLLLGCCTLTVVLIGLALVFFVALFPTIIVMVIRYYGYYYYDHHYYYLDAQNECSHSSGQGMDVQVLSQSHYFLLSLLLPTMTVGSMMMLLLLLLLNAMHLYSLWKSAHYLAFFRWLLLPIRRLLFPLVPLIARIESLREHEPTLYYNCCCLPVQQHNHADNNANTSPPSTSSSSQEPLILFRKSVRRHYRRMQKIYHKHSIQHKSVDAEQSLTLCEIIPVLWEHQQRLVDMDAKEANNKDRSKNPNSSTCNTRSSSHVLEEFIKRALVVTVVPDGILDLYYNTKTKELVSWQFSIWQGNVWHWFLYFCKNNACQMGIWWHGALLAIQRGQCSNNNSTTQSSLLKNSNHHNHHHHTNIRYVNAQIHQTDSKLHAGYNAADPIDDTDLLSQLYPLAFTKHIPEDIRNLRLWDD